MKIDILRDRGADRGQIAVSLDVSDSTSLDAFVISHPCGTPFHLLAWQQMIQDGFGYEPRHIIARSARGGEVLGVLPLFLVRSLIFGRILSSTLRANYGGILARFCLIARGSASELEYQVLLAHDLKLISSSHYEELNQQITDIKRMLTVLVQKLTADR